MGYFPSESETGKETGTNVFFPRENLKEKNGNYVIFRGKKKTLL